MEEEINIAAQQLGYFQQQRTANLTRFYIDEDIREPAYYRSLVQTLVSASEDDTIELWINSSGGRLDSTESIISGIMHSEAVVVAIINGAAYSAASMIALQCHETIVMPTATAMIHCASYGTSGKSSDIRGYTEFSTKKLDKMFDEIYEGFLTDEEITAVKNGKELWMLADEIMERLEKRNEYFKALMDAEAEKKEEEVAPKAPKKSKKTIDADNKF